MCQTSENGIFGVIVIMQPAFIFTNLRVEGWKSRSSRMSLLLKIFASSQFKFKSFSLLEGKGGKPLHG